eukprot:CAMPEP_0175130694 /NCGR_PEP_ID=MMETSP0087-20121206/6141_1 /TAXON_ID=136419 /ORGANISM="Unknown Unknown, Strain D1" /LENGTH=604 /DNA_ID=CAMNT_0016412925 /DNA_START=6 /DNA_END=1820 /DNA_ORIENTATION=-
MNKEFHLKAYSPVFLHRDNVNIEAGDKIVLHSDVLDKLNKQFPSRLPYPLVFEIRNKKRGVVSHCGVLEFSADENAAYLPQWMMQNLALDEGDTLHFKLKQNILKATDLTFKPQSKDFFNLPTPKETLEFALSKFTVLTENDEIQIPTGNSSQTLTVVTVKPKRTDVNPVVLLLQTTVKIEFDMTGAKESKEQGESDDATFAAIEFQQQESGDVQADRYVHYRVKVVDSQKSLKLTLTSTSGDPDLFVSTQTNPTLLSHTWSTIKTPNTETTKTGEQLTSLLIDKNDPDFVANWYYISVYGYKQDSSFTLLADETEEVEEVKAGQLLRTASDDPNAKRCENCLAFVPKGAHMMHSLQCVRINWRCPECHKLMRPSAKDQHTHCPQCGIGLNKTGLQKHLDLIHKKVRCPCGQEFEPEVFALHQKEECMLRLVNCKYCSMKVQATELKDHQDFCGSKSASCDLCGKDIPRKRMSHHKASEHGINPSLPRNHTGGLNDPPVQQFHELKDSTFGVPHRPASMQRQTSEEALSAAMLESMEDIQKEDDAILQAALAASMQSGNPTQASTTTAITTTPSATNSAQQCENCGVVVPGEYMDLIEHMAFCE